MAVLGFFSARYFSAFDSKNAIIHSVNIIAQTQTMQFSRSLGGRTHLHSMLLLFCLLVFWQSVEQLNKCIPDSLKSEVIRIFLSIHKWSVLKCRRYYSVVRNACLI